MKRFATPAALLICGVLALGLATLTAARAAEPPAAHTTGWRGPQRNGVYPGKGFPTTWSDTENIVWKVALPGLTIAEPVVVGDRVFTLADPDWLICVDINTGKILWQKHIDPIALQARQLGLSEQDVTADNALRDILWTAGFVRVGCGDGYSWRLGQEQVDAVMQALAQAEKVSATFKYKTPMTADTPATSKTAEQYMGDIGRYLSDKYGLKVSDWKTLIGFTPATPVTDGTYIYTTMAENQVACHDLEGNLVWARMLREPAGETKQLGIKFSGHRARYVPSPLLIDGKLVFHQGIRFAALDARTGQTIWEKIQDTVGEGYRCGSPVALRLQPGNVDVVVTLDGKVTRVSDGTVLCDKIGATGCGSETGGDSPVTNGVDTVYIYEGRNNGGLLKAIKLTPAGPDKVEPQAVWETAVKGPGGASHIYADGRIYYNHATEVYNAATGELITRLQGSRAGKDWPSPALADGYLFITDCPKFDNSKPFTCTVVKVEGDTLKTIAANALTSPTQPMPALDRFAPSWAKRSTNDYKMISTGPCIAGNRILFRSKSTLYCIGDPQVPYAGWGK